MQAGYINKTVFYNQRPRPSYGLYINTSRPLLDNLDVRIGINYATNWDLVIEKFFRGDYVRMNTANEGYGESSHPTLRARPFDIQQAQESFAKAGFQQRGPDGILVNGEGQRLAFTLTTQSEALKDILTILKEEAQKAGLEFRIEVLDETAGWKKIQEKQHEIAFTAFAHFLEEFPRFWEGYHSDNAYDQAFLPDGSVNPDRKLETQSNNLESFAVLEVDTLIAQFDLATSADEKMRLSHRIAELHHDYASFVPGYVQPFYRVGYWRWVQWPENFSSKHSEASTPLFVHWIDEELRAETLAARKSGQKFPPQIRVFDQFAEQ